MFRRIVKSLVNYTNKSSKPVITEADNLDLINAQSLFSKLQTNKSDKGTQALIDFRNSFRDLSPSAPKPNVDPDSPIPSTLLPPWDPSNIKKLLARDICELTNEELLQLGNAYFEGTKDGMLVSDRPKALEIWTLASNKGNNEATYSLASCYHKGVAVERNVDEAIKLFTELADREHGFACYSLALIYGKGEGVEVDDEKSFLYFRRAANSGIAPALYNIGNSYAAGKGTKQSDYNALLFYEAAVEAGDPSAMFTLGSWFIHGRHVKKDLKRAHTLHLQAANKGHPSAMFNVGCNYMSGQFVEKKDFLLAAQWFEKSANLGFVHAGINLGKMYYEGCGNGIIPRDLIKAREIFQKFAYRDEVCRQTIQAIDEELIELGSGSSAAMNHPMLTQSTNSDSSTAAIDKGSTTSHELTQEKQSVGSNVDSNKS